MKFSDFLIELCNLYKDHKTAPGVHVAWIPENNEFYASVHIFPNGIKSRTVFAKCTHADMGQCLGNLKAEFDRNYALSLDSLQKEIGS